MTTNKNRKKKIKDLFLSELYVILDDLQKNLQSENKQVIISHFAFYVAKRDKRELKKSYEYKE